MDLAAGKRIRVPANQLARRRLKQLRPHAKALGCDEALKGVDRVLQLGTGADRQVVVHAGLLGTSCKLGVSI
jgi:gamma-glutamyl:cysteine ligase YbdK (ATP-grasp superfamily)